MSEITFVLMDPSTIHSVEHLIQQQELDVEIADPNQYDNLEDTVAALLQKGTRVIISRGFLARIIRNLTSVPVVELQITRMELYQLILEARSRTGLERPRVAVIGSKSVFCSTDGLGEMAGVDLIVRQETSYDELVCTIDRFRSGAEAADAIIGGIGYRKSPQPFPAPFIPFRSGHEGIENALHMAQRVLYALDLTQKYAAMQQAVFDYTANGLILLDRSGCIQQINPPAAEMLHCDQLRAQGRPISRLLPSLKPEVLEQVLAAGQELTAQRQKLNKAVLMYSVSPVLAAGAASGAVISLTEGRQIEAYARESQRELLQDSESHRLTFEQLPCRSPAMQRVVEKAKRFSALLMPILLVGEVGTEKDELARCIHAASPLQEHRFVWFNCASAAPEAVFDQLFGEKALLHRLKGTLFLDHIEALSPPAQHRLYRFLYNQRYAETVSVWVLAGCEQAPAALVRSGQLRQDLADALGGLTLELPPLRQRPEDIAAWVQADLKAMQPRYGRYLHLTQEAWRRVREASFPGNVEQVHSFCQRLIAQAPRRTVDEETVDLLLPPEEPEPLPAAAGQTPPPAAPFASDPEEVQIRRLLRAHYGSRSEVAAILGISTTTLWRKMKKYGLT